MDAPLRARATAKAGRIVFAFPPVEARFVHAGHSIRPIRTRGVEIVEINLYAPAEAAAVLEKGRVAALGQSPVTLPAGESLTVDFRYLRYPLGASIEWGDAYGTVFSVHLSDDGKTFREVGRIETGDGVSDSFWWRSTTARFFRLTVHEGELAQRACANQRTRSCAHTQQGSHADRSVGASRLGGARRSLSPISAGAPSLLDRAGGGRSGGRGALRRIRQSRATPRVRADHPAAQVGRKIHVWSAREIPGVRQSLADGSLPIPTVAWSARDVELSVTAFAHAGQAVVEYRVANPSGAARGWSSSF